MFPSMGMYMQRAYLSDDVRPANIAPGSRELCREKLSLGHLGCLIISNSLACESSFLRSPKCFSKQRCCHWRHVEQSVSSFSFPNPLLPRQMIDALRGEFSKQLFSKWHELPPSLCSSQSIPSQGPIPENIFYSIT